MGSSKTGPVNPPSGNVTVCMTLTLAEANNLLVALANAINNASAKSAKGGKGKGKAKGGGTPKGGGAKGGGKPKSPAPTGKPKTKKTP